ncbi:hypothetical protein NC651_023567 [Populus alba x Populus x berolinensis]|nr:hypothetical protein NC651_023567 [Populus alba x Populus x berolinensis]
MTLLLLSSARLTSLWRREPLLSREAERRKRKQGDEAVSFLFFCKSLGLPAISRERKWGKPERGAPAISWLLWPEELAVGGWFLGMKTEEYEGGRA